MLWMCDACAKGEDMSSFQVSHDIIVTGSSAKLGAGYIAVSNCTLVNTAEGPILFDVGGTVAR